MQSLVLVLFALVSFFWTTWALDCDRNDCNTFAWKEPQDTQVVFMSIAMKSHAEPLLRVAQGMRDLGYNVSFATHDSGKDWVQALDLPFVSAGAFPVSAEDLRGKLRAVTRDSSNFRGILTIFSDIYVAAARPMFDALLPQFELSRPDLIVMDVATVGAQDLAHKLQVPHIVNSPSLMFDLGDKPSYVPAWGTGFSIHMSLWNRCMNILFPRLLSVALTPPYMQLNKVRWELQLKPYRSQHDVFRGARVLLNTAFGLEHPYPMSPLTEPVGPLLPLDYSHAPYNSRSLPSSLAKWLDPAFVVLDQQPIKPIVYIHLGSLAYIDAWQAEALVRGLTMAADEAPVKVLWVLPMDQRSILPAEMPPTFKVRPPTNLSTLDVLKHPHVRLVVSHCGMVAAQEALVSGHPLLCIPFLIDQPDIAARVVDAGAGISIDKTAMTPELVHAAARELLTNRTYVDAATRVGRLLERAGGTTRAIEVIRTGLRTGFGHLETLELSSPWHKAVMLDVWTVYVAIFCLVAALLRVLWLLVYFGMSKSWTYLVSKVSRTTDDRKRD